MQSLAGGRIRCWIGGINYGCVCVGNWKVVEVAAKPCTLGGSIQLKPQVGGEGKQLLEARVEAQR